MSLSQRYVDISVSQGWTFHVTRGHCRISSGPETKRIVVRPLLDISFTQMGMNVNRYKRDDI